MCIKTLECCIMLHNYLIDQRLMYSIDQVQVSTTANGNTYSVPGEEEGIEEEGIELPVNDALENSGPKQ